MDEYDCRQADKAAMRWLQSLGIWLCPLCGSTREPESTVDFERRRPPDRPCRFCGCKLTHGIKMEDGRVGEWNQIPECGNCHWWTEFIKGGWSGKCGFNHKERHMQYRCKDWYYRIGEKK